MAIDPMLYEKLSGKKGDPRERAALLNAQHATRPDMRSRVFKERVRTYLIGRYVIGPAILLGVLGPV